MTSITQTIDNYIGGISQQPDEKKLPGQLVKAKNVLPDVVEGLKKRPGSNLIGSLSDGSANSVTHGKWFHYYRDENEQYIGQISRSGTVKMWDCLTGTEKTVTNNLNTTTTYCTYARTSDGLVSVNWRPTGTNYAGALAEHPFQVGDVIDADFITGGANDGTYEIVADNHGGDKKVFKFYDGGSSVISGALHVQIKQNYLHNVSDADLQTLTLNDYTYITNRKKRTAMKDLLAGSYNGDENYNNVRQPEAFVELKKVSYASQYALNLYDDDTLEDVTTATRISVKRVVDSSNGCTNSTTFPSSGTLPGSSGHTSYCLNTDNEHEDSACPNVDTRLISFNPGTAWDADDSNGVAGAFTYTRGGVTQGLYEVQRNNQVTVAASKVYHVTGANINNMELTALSSNASEATIDALITKIKAHAGYANSGITVKAENITTAVKEIQKIENVSMSFNYSQYSPNVLYWQVEGITISPQTQSNCNLECAILALQNHADYGSLDATVSHEAATNGDSNYRNIVFTFKENKPTSSLSKMGNHHPDWGTGTVYTANTTATGAVEAIPNKGEIVATFTTTGAKGNIALWNQTDTVAVHSFSEETVSSTIANPPKDLYLRITTTGQAVAESDAAQPEYRCRYTTTHDLLYGGQNWLVGDYFEVWMKNAKYRITVDKISTSRVQANRGLIRPTPTSFDTKTVVTAESILGELRAAIDADENSNFNTNEDGALNSAGPYVSGVKQVGNGLHITRRSGDFNLATPSPALLNVFTNEIQDIADLPSQCVHGYTVKIRNSEATEDDYYVRFIADNDRNGTGVWEECPDPGRKIKFDENTMPIQLVRNADGTFTLDEIDWQICIAGNTTTVPEPSFIGKHISKMMFWRNRMILLSDENVIMSQPGEYFNYWPKSSITYTASDVIDLSVSSEFPAIIYDGAQTNSGLILFSKNQQYLLTTDSDVLSPQTAKINTIATYNFNFNTNPISLGTTTAFLDNAGKFSRLWEMANVLREGEPIVVDQTKVVSKLFDKDLNLIANSRENSIIFFTKKGSSTIYGYKYFSSSEKRLQQSWFTWELAGAIQHIAVLDDALFIVLRNNSKDALVKISIKIDDDTHTSVDDKGTTDTSDDVTYRIHLDNTKKLTLPVPITTSSFNIGATGSTKTYNITVADNSIYTLGDIHYLTFSDASISSLNGWYSIIWFTNTDTVTFVRDNSASVDASPPGTVTVSQYESTSDVTKFLVPHGYELANLKAYVISGENKGQISELTVANSQSIPAFSGGVDVSFTGSYATVPDDYTCKNNTTTSPLHESFVLGYNYDMEVQFPTIYYTQQTGDVIKVDTNGSLIIQRVKVNFGGKGLYETTIDRVGKPSYTETWEAPLADSYDANQVAIDDFITQTIPTYEKNKNLTIKLKSTHPTPATLYSMSWEGDYTTNYYQRV